MRRKAKTKSLSFTKVLELIGKPAFFLFTIVVVSLATFLQLIKFPSLKLPNPKPRKRKASVWRTFLKRNSWLQAKKGSPAGDRRVLMGTLLVFIFIFFAFNIYYFILRDLPSITLLTDSPPSLSTKIYDRSGELLYQIYKDENRSLIKLDQLPKYLKDATLAAEDKNFYHHFGVDPLGIIRATFNNLTKGTTQGGSTITQQLVKNTLLSPEKTFIRKIKELILSLQAESAYTKDQILEMYLNQVGYGGTAYGIEEAARQYFGKSARDLTLAESAMLAGLPISPTILSPFGTNPYLGKIRQQQVLESMVATNTITEDEKVSALATPLVFHPQGISIRAPHFVMYVKDLLVKEYGEAVVARGGLSVTTTLDLNLQNTLQTEINQELSTLTKLHVQNGAGLILDPKTGEVLAMVGSRNFFDSEHDGQVNITLQSRQPGSSIKPITYALALSSGATPSTTIDDTPICFTLTGQPNYCPKNYDGRFHGKVTLRTALASSYNIPAIKLLNTYGLPNMITLARNLGITTWDDPTRFGLSLTLGGGEITMLDLASVYSVFARGGTKVPLTSILSVKDSQGSDLVWEVSSTGDLAKGQVGTPKVGGDSPRGVQVLSPSVAYQINSILSDSGARAPAFGYSSVLNLPGKNVAVKTGTTNDLRDNWTFGYTQDYLVATWVGNNDNSSMSSVASGITGASPIWARTMKSLVKDHPPLPFSVPSNMIAVNLSCTEKPRYEYFVKGTAPKINCAELDGTLLPTADSTSR